jgi:hypothetical protein
LTGGIKSKSKIFKLSELEKNEFNTSTNPLQWKPTIRPTYQYCTCSLIEFSEGSLWDYEKQSFSMPDPDYMKKIKRPLIRVLINGKEKYL